MITEPLELPNYHFGHLHNQNFYASKVQSTIQFLEFRKFGDSSGAMKSLEFPSHRIVNLNKFGRLNQKVSCKYADIKSQIKFQIIALKHVFFLALFLMQVKNGSKTTQFSFRRSSILRFIEPLSFLDGLVFSLCKTTIQNSRCDMIINTDVVKKTTKMDRLTLLSIQHD